ncbi:MAG: histidine--tRNA ligase [Methylacidiphilales bacterium]|nr:histidine--tRNA ligase [Candidatus Methylacidiphilales bacterium]MDW8350139.1 histidine--tRNA ligase [Verrucomicrobiae bacterium]
MQALPGFRDFYPEDCAFREGIVATWCEVSRRYGFVRYDAPPLEPLELYTQKSGGEIVGQLYHFVDKGGRAVALRPEMTPSLTRMVAARYRDYRKPMKWFSVPQVFRYERMQRGRLREHFQWNCDIIGEAGLQAEVELIALVIDGLRAFGLGEDDFVVRLSDRVFWADFLRKRNVPEERWYEVFQAIDKCEREPREKTSERLGVLADEVMRVINEGAASERLDEVEAGLARRGLGGYVRRDFRIVRGLAYYTGVVFEVFDRGGAFRAIAGGGRYDELFAKQGNESVPAVGFGMGDVVLGEILRLKGWKADRRMGVDVFIFVEDEKFRADADRWTQALRENGLCVDVALKASKISRQYELAEERGARWGVMFDQQGVLLKNLVSRELRRVNEVGEVLALVRL